MPQHDFVLDDQNGLAFLADLNSALGAIISNSSGPVEPTTTYAHQWWADTTADILKVRNAANTGWVNILTLSGITASNIANTPAGNISSIDVQSALNELGVEKLQINPDGGFSTSGGVSYFGSQNGVEGGQFTLLNGSNSTLGGLGLVVDQTEGMVRFFEEGGALRGATLDISAQGSAITSTIITSSNVGVGANQIVQLDGSAKLPQDIQLCKAWVNFNGTGVLAIRDGYNVSSITDSGVGTFTFNFTTALGNANFSYSMKGGGGAAYIQRGFEDIVATTTTALHSYWLDHAYNGHDPAVGSLQIFGG